MTFARVESQSLSSAKKTFIWTDLRSGLRWG